MTSNNGRYSAPSFNGILDLKPWYEMCVCCGLNGILDLKHSSYIFSLDYLSLTSYGVILYAETLVLEFSQCQVSSSVSYGVS